MNANSAQAYLVCATPRSGSTLLCEMLRATGCAGHPLEHFEVLRHSSLPRQPREYFEGLTAPDVLELLAPLHPDTPDGEPPEAWWARIRAQGSTPNGVWGGKIMWGHVPDFVARARELPDLADANLGKALRTLLGDPRLIFVTRQDKAAQAVSLWRAVQTQSWRAEDPGYHETPVYLFSAIHYLVAQLQADERSWAQWFARSRTRPLHVSYEQLDAAPRLTTTRILTALGLPCENVPDPELSRQRDEVSLAWIERYRRDRERAA
jgi:trehalose 2-sulfotransferase